VVHNPFKIAPHMVRDLVTRFSAEDCGNGKVRVVCARPAEALENGVPNLA
jgi:hypothetical protein